MDRKKVPLAIGAISLLLLIIIVLISNDKTAPLSNCCNDPGLPSSDIQKINVYLETSLSMKGYVDAPTTMPGTYKLKQIPTLISKIAHKGISYELFTTDNATKTFQSTIDDFNENLTTGKIFTGVQSNLQNSIALVIDSLKPKQISLFISDCIIDLGPDKININDLPIVTGKLHNHIIQKDNLGVLVFQYLSDFNGNYYYNCINNRGITGNRHKEKQMNNRPFYVWCFGNPVDLKQLLNDGLFGNDFENSYSYGISSNCRETKSQILPFMQKGKMLIGKDHQSVTFIEFSDNHEFSFTIGLDLSSVPEYAKTQDYMITNKNLIIYPDYLNQTTTFNLVTLNELKSHPSFARFASIVNPDLTHFITINFKQLDTQHCYKLILKQSQPEWIQTTHLADDRDIDIKEIEGKTFGFSSITGAFAQAFDQQNHLFEIAVSIPRNK